MWIRHPLLALVGVVALTVPWLVIRALGLVPTLPRPVVFWLACKYAKGESPSAEETAAANNG